MVLDTMPRRQNGSALALMRKDPPYLKMSSRGIKHKQRLDTAWKKSEHCTFMLLRFMYVCVQFIMYTVQ